MGKAGMPVVCLGYALGDDWVAGFRRFAMPKFFRLYGSDSARSRFVPYGSSPLFLKKKKFEYNNKTREAEEEERKKGSETQSINAKAKAGRGK